MDRSEAEALLGLDVLKAINDSYDFEDINQIFEARVKQFLDEGKHGAVSRLAEARQVALDALQREVFASSDSEAIEQFEKSEAERVIEYLIASKTSTLVTGKAGTGKSYLLNNLVSKTGKKGVAVVAPTGAAALNVEGETIHSFFGFGLGLQMVDLKWLKSITPKNQLKFSVLEVLIIDEISMVNADIIDAIDAILRKCKDPDKPFGGVRILMFGDPLQLQPVSPKEQDVKDYIRNYYGTFWFFNAKAWHEASYEIIELTEIKRQQDEVFATLLSNIRVNKNVDFKLLNSRVGAKSLTSNPIRLVGTNRQVAQHNEDMMNELPASETLFVGKVQILDETFRFAENDLPVEIELRLKPGAQVMFVKNDDQAGVDGLGGKRRWVNGTVGTITAVHEDGVFVRTDDHEPMLVKPSVWKQVKHKVVEEFDETTKKTKKVLKPVEVASYTQLPLKPAWAITIHKSQGKTYEDVVVDLDSGFKAPGLAYVALSRVKEFNGLSLKSFVGPGKIDVDGDALYFLESRTLLRPDQLVMPDPNNRGKLAEIVEQMLKASDPDSDSASDPDLPW